MSILVTGAAGFIGFHLSRRLLKEGVDVIGIDNLNSYYDPVLKEARLQELSSSANSSKGDFYFCNGDLEDNSFIKKTFSDYNPSKVVNLAAQAGVRYSIENPSAYITSNLVGFGNIIECCRHFKVNSLIYASSSSVYGGNTKLPFFEDHGVDHPISLYAATKKSNELIAHTYSHLYGLPTIGLRFFTVYGPWGRPDMALFLFTKSILERKPIQIFNNGQMVRDFTYIDDIIESIVRLLDRPASPDEEFNTLNPRPSTSWAPYRIFNIGNGNPTPLMDYIQAVEDSLGMTAIKEFLPMQPGDVPATASDCSSLESWVGYRPFTPVSEGVKKFVDWYRNFYSV